MKGYTLRESRDLRFQQYNHIFSLNENRAIELCHSAEDKVLFEDHNLEHMCRVYPKTCAYNLPTSIPTHSGDVGFRWLR